MAQLKHKFLPEYTYTDYAAWEGNWELIYGVPYAMAPTPAYNHQRINSRILGQLLGLLENCQTCEALMPLDYKIGDDIVLQPDVLIVCEPYEKGTFISKTPELVVEILSPSTREKDLNLKFEIYQNQGVRYYVIIDPEIPMAFVYQLIDGVYKLMLKTSLGSFDFQTEYCAFSFDFSKIW